MAKGLTPKQDAFALKYVECGNASEAYRTCYDVAETTKPEVIWVKACETLGNGKVSVRVAELQMLAQERTLVTIESITIELDVNRARADDLDQVAAMNQATLGKAKVNGLLVDKNETNHSGKIGGNWTVEVVRPKATE